MKKLLFVFVAFLMFLPSVWAQGLSPEVLAAARKRNVFISTCKMRRSFFLPFWKYCERYCASGVSLGEGMVLTACHAVYDRRNITADGKRALVVACDKKSDLALLRVPGYGGEGVPPLVFGKSVMGKPIIVFSNPDTIRNKVTYGNILQVITEVDTNHRYERLRLMSDALILQGSSGGAAYDVDGLLVGIATNISETGEYSFFTSAEDVKSFLENLGVNIRPAK